MAVLDIVLVLISLALIGWVFFLRDDMLKSERFASDWNTVVWGQSLWNGWDYASAPPLTAPRPEDTSWLN